MGEPRRIQITHIHPRDGFYPYKDQWIGQMGTFELSRNSSPGYYSGQFRPDDPKIIGRFFLGIRYIRV